MKTLVKTEYDVIFPSELGKDSFKYLENFVLEASNLDENESQPSFFKRIEKGGHPAIKVQNYVGVICLPNDVQVEVLPKIELNNNGEYDINETRRIFLKMLRCMDENLFKSLNSANLDNDNTPLFEIFISQFLYYVLQLAKKGLRSNYIQTEDNLGTFKGKLLVQQNIRHNLVHQERFFVQFDEFKLNRPENKLIKTTLLFLSGKSRSQKNITEIRKLLLHFEQVDCSANIDSDFSKVTLDRNTKDYATVLSWAKIFLQRKSFSIFSGTSSVQSILFPMEKVFESFVGKKMKKALAQESDWQDWSLKLQVAKKNLFDEPKKFRLKPDLLLSNPTHTIILDTKWKRLINNPNKNYGISQGDMYQMYAYGHKYNSSNIWLLYPQNKELCYSRNGILTFKSCGSETSREINVSVFFIDVNQIENSLKCLLARIEQQAH